MTRLVRQVPDVNDLKLDNPQLSEFLKAVKDQLDWHDERLKENETILSQNTITIRELYIYAFKSNVTRKIAAPGYRSRMLVLFRMEIINDTAGSGTNAIIKIKVSLDQAQRDIVDENVHSGLFYNGAAIAGHENITYTLSPDGVLVSANETVSVTVNAQQVSGAVHGAEVNADGFAVFIKA